MLSFRETAFKIFVVMIQVEGMNCLVSELADVAAQGRAMLDECESVLGSTAALQVRKKQGY